MTLSVLRHERIIQLQRDELQLLEVHFSRNRYHYHPRVFRLHFEQATNLDAALVAPGLDMLLAELRAATANAAPLLFRTTLPKDSPLVDGLMANGFLETRRVYEPWLHPGDVAEIASGSPAGVELLTIWSALDRNLHDRLVSLYVEIYARTSRLDPATPEQLSATEWTAELLADPDLDRELSCCLIRDGRPVGLMTVYRSEEAGRFELGPFGVTGRELGAHQELTGAMLARVVGRLRDSGHARAKLVAEIDSDDPWTLYTCAEFPFRFGATSVSLVLVPAWQA